MTYREVDGTGDDGDAPLWGGRRRRIQRIVVWLAVIALVAPGILVAWGVAQATAARTCAVYIAALRPDAGGSAVAFELFGRGGPGWQCYAVSSSGPHSYLGPLGLIPSAPHLSPRLPPT